MSKAMLILILAGMSQVALGTDIEGSCIKGGKTVDVKGDTETAKMESCVAAMGKWTKEKKEAKVTGDAKKPKETKKEASGGGGGW